MNWKYLIGKTVNQIDKSIIVSNLSVVKSHYPFGRHWVFDLKRTLKFEPKIIIDAGANIGSVSLELNKFFPNSDIFAFEPILETNKQLIKNTKAIGNIKPQHFALGKVEESIEIYLNPESTINSIKSKYLNENNSLGKEIIHVKRLDQFCNSLNIYHVHILKIDVEGFEFEVLDGCGDLIQNSIDCIFLEVGYEREDTKVHFSDVESYLEKYDYQLCGIYEIMRHLDDKRKISYSNNLYIKKHLIANR